MTQQSLIEEPLRQVHINVYAPPEPKGSFFAIMTAKGPRAIPDNSKSKAWEKAVKLAASRACTPHDWLPFDRPCAVEFHFRLVRPKKPKFGLPASRPDWDKLSRSTGDALEGIAYTDDARIVEARVTKAYSDTPGCSIVVREVQQ